MLWKVKCGFLRFSRNVQLIFRARNISRDILLLDSYQHHQVSKFVTILALRGNIYIKTWDEFGRGPKIFGVLCPPQVMFYCISRKEFFEFFKLEFHVRQFFSKISQNFKQSFWNFSNFFKIDKKFTFEPKVVQNHYVDQNLAKFSRKLKKCRFSPNTLHFLKFSAP